MREYEADNGDRAVLPDIAFLNVIHVFFFVCENLRFSSVFLTNHVFPTFFRPFLQNHTNFDPFHRYLLQNNMFLKKSLAPSALANFLLRIYHFASRFQRSDFDLILFLLWLVLFSAT